MTDCNSRIQLNSDTIKCQRQVHPNTSKCEAEFGSENIRWAKYADPIKESDTHDYLIAFRGGRTKNLHISRVVRTYRSSTHHEYETLYGQIYTVSPDTVLWSKKIPVKDESE